MGREEYGRKSSATEPDGTVKSQLRLMEDFGYEPAYVAFLEGGAITSVYSGADVKALRDGKLLASKSRFASVREIGPVAIFTLR